MFESVVFPAPFSPSSACTSPTAASKSTRSLATTPGKRFVICRMETAGTEEAPAEPTPLVWSWSRRGGCASPTRLALRAADHALDEPVHGVQILDRQLLASRNSQLALLVVERSRELVELPRDQSRALRLDRCTRLRGHTLPEGSDVREAVLDVPVVEARLPGSVDRSLDARDVVHAPVVDACGQPRGRSEFLRVRVVPDPRDLLRLRVLAGGRRVDVLAEDVH